MSEKSSSISPPADSEGESLTRRGYSTQQIAVAAEEIESYDPDIQRRMIQGRLKSLEIINERFACQCKPLIFNLLRRSADVACSGVKIQAYHEFERQLPLPAHLNLVRLNPLKGMALFTFSADLVFMLVDSLFGGDGRPSTLGAEHEFTATEQQIVQRLLSRLLPVYDAAWRSIYAIKSAFLRSEMRVRFAPITSSPHDIVVTTTFTIKTATQSGRFAICIPFSMIEPLRKIFITPPLEPVKIETINWRNSLISELKNAEVELVAKLKEKTYRLSEVMEIKKGEVILFEKPAQIEATIDAIPVLTADYGCAEDHYAICVENIITSAISLLKKGYLQDE